MGLKLVDHGIWFNMVFSVRGQILLTEFIAGRSSRLRIPKIRTSVMSSGRANIRAPIFLAIVIAYRAFRNLSWGRNSQIQPIQFSSQYLAFYVTLISL